MRIRYDEKMDALYIRLKESDYEESDQIKDDVILDYDKNGNIIGIEILDASSYMQPSELSSINFEVERAIPDKAAVGIE